MAESYADKILDAIEYLTDNAISSAQYDKTIQATITAVADAATGKYKIKYQDSSFYAYSTNPSVTYNNGASVYVLIPNNDFSRNKTILGTVANLGINYGSDEENKLKKYDLIGSNNIQQDSSINLCTFKTTREKILYQYGTNINLINYNADNAFTNISKADSIILGANIKTNIPLEQRFHGNYGIIYDMKFRNEDNDNLIDRRYIVDINQMLGDPYDYIEETQQYIPFDIDGEHFERIDKIFVFCYDFPIIENGHDDDIFLTQICAQAAAAIPEDEVDATRLILTPTNPIFSASSSNRYTTIKASLKINGKEITFNDNNISYYWFVENLSVNRNDIRYNQYGGLGWECLNKYNVLEGTDENPTKIQFVPNQYKYIGNAISEANESIAIERARSLAYETKYKCIAIYGNIVLSKEIIVTDYANIINALTIVSSNGTEFYDSLGKTTLTANIDGDGYSFFWAKINSAGDFELLPETTSDNNNYKTTKQKLEEKISKIEQGIEYANANAAIIAEYEQILSDYETITRVEKNQIINLLVSDIINYHIYKCGVYKNDIYMGTAEIRIVNNTRDTNRTFDLVIQNGTQTFKYNAAGVSPASKELTTPKKIESLSFILYDEDGNIVPDENIRVDGVQWLVPINDTMLKIDDSQVKGDIDETTKKQVYKGKTLVYNIDEKYHSQKDNNEIELRVTYKNKIYRAVTHLTFLKEGENGTNGTDFIVRIVPRGENEGYITLNNTTNKTGNLDIQLWRDGQKIFTGYRTGQSSEDKTVTITWSILGRNSGNQKSAHSISINNGTVTVGTYTAAGVDLVQAQVKYEGLTNYAVAPVSVIKDLKTNYKINLKENTGFRYVIYAEDGRNPVYDNSYPFEIVIEKYINGFWEDISNKCECRWTTVGDIVLAKSTSGLVNNPIAFKPKDKYDEDTKTHAVVCTIYENGSTNLGQIHIPIYFMINQYGHDAINGWDGNSVQLDADGNTMLLAPQAGFGEKDNITNTYSGLLLGKVKNYTNNSTTTERGLFGYDKGIRTLFLNSDNGSAIFGAAGKAQIIIDPSQNEAILKSGNFNETEKTGMQINLSEPNIKYGNGNFVVTKEGHLTAKGGGSIAGWEISDTELSKTITSNGIKYTTRLSSDATNVTNAAIEIKTGNTIMFKSQYDGLTYMRTAKIGNGGEQNYIIVGNDGSNSAIYNNKEKLRADKTGFYIGNNGFALGRTTDYDIVTGKNKDTHSVFEVLNDGTLYASNAYLLGNIQAHSGYIGTVDQGWTIENKSLWNGKEAIDSLHAGIYLGTNGIAFGTEGQTPEFSVMRDGTLYSVKGKIGGWTITDYKLTGAASKPMYLVSTNYIDEKNQTQSENVIYTGEHSLLNSTKEGFYLSPQGLSIGSKVYIDKNGVARFGKNATTKEDNCWTIDVKKDSQNNETEHSYIKYGIQGQNKSVYLGTDKVTLGENVNYQNVMDNQDKDKELGTHAKFEVLNDGTLYAGNVYLKGRITATSGYIGDSRNGWTIKDKYIYNGKDSLSSAAAGVYLGVDGIALGTKKVGDTNLVGFQVTDEGVMTARNGYIGNGSNGWIIQDTSIYNGKNSLTNQNAGIYIGTDGIALGSQGKIPEFSVTQEGKIYSISGTIGGWTIADNELKGAASDTMHLISTSYKVGNETKPQNVIYTGTHNLLTSTTNGFYLSPEGLSIGSKVYINSDGTARFGKGAITNDNNCWTIGTDNTNSYIKYKNSGDSESVYIGTDQITLGKNFLVNNEGYLQAKSGYIGSSSTKGWNITTNGIYNIKTTFTTVDTEGIYLGSDGIALGKVSYDNENYNAFQVNEAGEFIARTGYIGNGSNGWTIKDKYIYNNKTGLSTAPTGDSNTTGVYIGTNGIGLGALNDYSAVSNRAAAGTHSMFEVTNKGILYAKGVYIDGTIVSKAGTIGGWNLTDTTLYSNKKADEGRITIDAENQGKIYSHNHNTLTNTGVGFYLSYDGLSIGSKFKVTNDGVLRLGKNATSNGTYSWEINGDSNSDISYIKYGNRAAANSVYIGTDAIVLGNDKFTVTNAGLMTARSGYIGNGINGWTIGNNYIHNNKSTINTNSANGVYIGTNGIGLGKIVSYADIENSDDTDTHSAFEVLNSGKLYANDVVLNGILYSAQGQIGGWKIQKFSLSSGVDTSYVELNSAGSTSNDINKEYAIWAGDTHPGSAPFYIKKDGTLKAAKVDLSGGFAGTVTMDSGTIDTGDYFKVTRAEGTSDSPTMYAKNAIIETSTINNSTISKPTISSATITDSTYTGTATIKATSTIGKFTVASSSIYNGKNSLNNTSSDGVYIGTDGISLGKDTASTKTFQVTSAGSLTSTKGTIGGWTIESNSLHSGNATSYIGLSSSSDTIGIWAGNATAADAPTKLQRNGKFISSNIELTGGTIDIHNSDSTSQFKVESDGKLTANNALITMINSSKLGAFTLSVNNNNTAIYHSKSSLTNEQDGVYLGQDGIALGKKDVFKVSRDGTFTSTNATLTIKNGSSLGAFTIGEKTIYNTKSSIIATDTNDGICISTDGIALGKSGKFIVTKAGNLTSTDATIGGWTVNGQYISTGAGDTYVGLDSSSTTSSSKVVLWAGNATAADAPFRVQRNGNVHIGTVDIDGGTIDITSAFTVSSTGAFTSTNATVELQNDSKIGLFTVKKGTSTTSIQNKKTSLIDSNDGVYIGLNGIALGKDSIFKITDTGAVTATSVSEATGKFNITSGTIGGGSDKFTLTKDSNSTYSGFYCGLNHTTYNATGDGIYIGTDGISAGSLKLTTSGHLTTTGSTFTNPTITGSTISDATISGSTTITNPTIKGTNGTNSYTFSGTTNDARINEIPKIYSGTGDPSSSTGKNGDIYIKYA